MDILYKQRYENQYQKADDSISVPGITNCYFKRVLFSKDRSAVNRKMHFHTGFEIHIVESGYQIYDIEDSKVAVKEGEYLIIPPLVGHMATEEAANTKKYAISFFSSDDGGGLLNPEHPMKSYYVNDISDAISDCLTNINSEYEQKKPFSDKILSLKVAECILLMLRAVGIAEAVGDEVSEEDRRLSMAKQYIKDNLKRNILLSELADYCYMSEKQLTRIFKSYEGISATEYIRKKRCLLIEKLLADPDLTLQTISDIMGFNNEYYFNAFFKKNTGMTPGAYRKSVLKI